MADNLAVTPGTGATVAADDISSVLYQRVKISLGADGSAVDAVAGAGAVSTGVQRVTLASDDPAVAALGSVKTAVEAIDNAISGTEMQVDVVGALPAGTNAIGKLAANSGVDIGDVDVLTIAGVAPDFGSGSTGSDTLRVVSASDDPIITAITGNVADGAADSGNTAKVGGVARTANPTAVDSGDRAPIMLDKLGRQVVVGALRESSDSHAITITSSTSATDLIAAGAAGVFHDVYGIAITNTSASATTVSIIDAGSGGKTYKFSVPAGETRGFMVQPGFGLKQVTAAAKWQAQCADSVASIEITALYVKNA